MQSIMLRLVSISEEAINLRAEGISLIYGGMLEKNGLTFYKHIHILHTGEKDQSVVFEEKRKDIDVRISSDLDANFALKDDHFIQLTMIAIIHEALSMLARQDGHLDIEILNSIKAQLIKTPLDFRVKYKTFTHPKDKATLVNIIVHPLIRHFDIYLELEKNGVIAVSLLIYKGMNVPTYFPDYFSKGKWLKKEFILSGNMTDMDIHLSLEDYMPTYVSTSGVEGKAPKFEFMKADTDRGKALDEWLRTLNPAIVAILTGSTN